MKKKIVASVVAAGSKSCDFIKIYNRGKFAGDLTVAPGDGKIIDEALALVNLTPVELLQYAFNNLAGEPIPPAETKIAAHFDRLIMESTKKAIGLLRFSKPDDEIKEITDLLKIQADLFRSIAEVVEQIKIISQELNDVREVMERPSLMRPAKRMILELIDGFREGRDQGEEL